MRHSWPCFGWGLPSHPGHPECWCALTAPFHPYHREVAVCSLWHFPASHLGLPLAITPLCEVRTFLESPVGDPRPPSQLVRAINVLGDSRKAILEACRRFRRCAIYYGPGFGRRSLCRSITVDDLAAAAWLSRAHFSRMFTRTFGESPRHICKPADLNARPRSFATPIAPLPISASWSVCGASVHSRPASPACTASAGRLSSQPPSGCGPRAHSELHPAA